MTTLTYQSMGSDLIVRTADGAAVGVIKFAVPEHGPAYWEAVPSDKRHGLIPMAFGKLEAAKAYMLAAAIEVDAPIVHAPERKAPTEAQIQRIRAERAALLLRNKGASAMARQEARGKIREYGDFVASGGGRPGVVFWLGMARLYRTGWIGSKASPKDSRNAIDYARADRAKGLVVIP